MTPTIYTIGHSTRPFDDFVAILRAHRIATLADVRTVPRSRRHPWFSREALAASLPPLDIAYEHIAELGGLRKPRADSPNTAWRNDSFRGYADYMATAAFQAGLERLLALARASATAAMCAEAVPWRCHRSLIADALVARGHTVVHLMSATCARPHELTPFARVEGGCVTYPALI